MTMTDQELYWDIVTYITGTIRICATGFLLYRFLKPFLPESRYTASTGIVYALLMIVLKLYPADIDPMICYTAGIILEFFVMILHDARNAKQKAFLSVTWFLMEWLIWGIMLIPWSCLYQALIMPREMMDRPLLQFILFTILQILHSLLVFAGLAMIIRVIHRVYQDKQADMTVRELTLMSAPVMTMLAGYWILHMYSLVYETDTGTFIWDTHPEHFWIQLLYMTLSFASVLTAIVAYQSIRDSQRRETEDAVLSRQMEDMKRHISEVEQLYAGIRELKHDMGNHVMILEQLYETSLHTAPAGESGFPPQNTACSAGCPHRPQTADAAAACQPASRETKIYLARLKQRVHETVRELQSGHPVTDVILWEKQKEALEKGIDFACSFHYPECPGVSAFDIGIVLSNALNNALEAAQKCANPYIRISSYHRKHTFVIEIRNSMLPGPPLPMQNGLPLTTRKGGEHGFGLASIRRVAGNYRGDINIVMDGGSFLLSVMLLTG